MDIVAAVNKIKENALLLVMVGIACIIAVNVVKSKEQEIRMLKSEAEVEQQKNTVIEEIAGNEQRLKTLVDSVNARLSKSAIDALGSIAKSASVRIVTINKQGEPALGPEGTYVKTSYDVILAADSYHKIGSFVSLVEQAPDLFTVDMLQVKSSASAADAERVSATVSLGAITLKEKP
ncbi:MAG: hypothetical protein PHT59_03925 [Candidatus Omnitrophica bacterium]|nr:hypothetical protein [Candidatus Omnitrophota bacterium]